MSEGCGENKGISRHSFPSSIFHTPPPSFTTLPLHLSSFCPLLSSEAGPFPELWIPFYFPPPPPPQTPHSSLRALVHIASLHPSPLHPFSPGCVSFRVQAGPASPQSLLWCCMLRQGSLALLSCLCFPLVGLTHQQGHL